MVLESIFSNNIYSPLKGKQAHNRDHSNSHFKNMALASPSDVHNFLVKKVILSLNVSISTTRLMSDRNIIFHKLQGPDGYG